MTYGGHFDIDEKKKQISELEKEVLKEDFWDDKKKAENVIDELNNLKQIVESLMSAKKKLEGNLK